MNVYIFGAVVSALTSFLGHRKTRRTITTTPVATTTTSSTARTNSTTRTSSTARTDSTTRTSSTGGKPVNTDTANAQATHSRLDPELVKKEAETGVDHDSFIERMWE